MSTAGSGLVFVNSYTANDSQQYINDIVAAEHALEGLWTNSVTINVSFDEKAMGNNGTLANNTWTSWTPVSYTQLKNALPGSDSLPSTDPTGGHTWNLPEAYARMLGLSSSTPSVDDSITLNSSYNWGYGQDVVNTVEHELSEGAMGRVGGLGDQNGVWSTMDLFRYSAPGVRDFTDGRDGRTTYFSADGSTLSSLSFNNEYNSSGVRVNTGDTADFAQQDVFGTGSPGETETLSQTDIAVMDALGWKQRITPTVNGANFSVATNQSVPLSAELSISNTGGDAISSYWVYDIGGGTGHLTVGGVAEPDGQWVQASSQWSNVQYVGGPAAGTDSLDLAMYDATTGNFVYSSYFRATTSAPHVPPTLTGSNVSVARNHSTAVAPTISISNPSGDPITSYWVIDLGGGTGHLTVGGAAEPDDQWIQAGGDWSNVDYVGGHWKGTDTIGVSMYDSTTGSYIYDAFYAHTHRHHHHGGAAGDLLPNYGLVSRAPDSSGASSSFVGTDPASPTGAAIVPTSGTGSAGSPARFSHPDLHHHGY